VNLRRKTMKYSFRLAACLAMCAAALLVVSCAKAPAGKWMDGAYQGKAEGLHADILVTVTVKGGRIAEVKIDQQHEAAGVSDVAFTRIPEQIVKEQNPKVDAVTGASYTSKAIMAAVEDALTKAVKN
jgi:urocanate reductase